MTHKFKKGDIVKLKSGGPPMTIESVPSEYTDDYKTVWFKGATKESSRFASETLEKYEAPKKNDS